MNYVWIAGGGALGAGLRAGLGVLVPYQHWTTLGINLMGCLLLGFLLAFAAETGKMSEQVRLGLGTGVLGGFTTFSTFSVEGVFLVQSSQLAQAAFYILGSLIGGVLCAWLGAFLAKRAVKRI